MTESLSALFQASTSGNVGVINLLLKKGADVVVTDKDGVTTLMSAASHGHAQVTGFMFLIYLSMSHSKSSGDTKTYINRVPVCRAGVPCRCAGMIITFVATRVAQLP